MQAFVVASIKEEPTHCFTINVFNAEIYFWLIGFPLVLKYFKIFFLCHLVFFPIKIPSPCW